MTTQMENLLELRELRASFQKQLQKQFNKTLIVIKPNYPGANKSNPYTNFVTTKAFFDLKTIVNVIDYRVSLTLEGLIYYLIVSEDPYTAKNKSIEIENQTYGRLLDIDVYRDDLTISRSDLDILPRKCFICDDMAHICTRSQKHDVSLVINYFDQTAQKIILENTLENLTIYGLINELCKPFGLGCVGVNDCGSHRDMDIYTFINSIEVLKKQLPTIAQVNTNDFNCLRQFGLQVEKAMFMKTGNINTHKGAIFIFILLYAGLINAKTYDMIQTQIKLLCTHILDDFNESNNTHGAKIYHDLHIQGVRGDAYNGFNLYFNTFEPYYRQNKNIMTLYFLIISKIVDTTIIHRSNIQTLKDIQSQASYLLAHPKLWSDFDKTCRKQHISCGGSSDVLATVLIIHFIKDHFFEIKKQL